MENTEENLRLEKPKFNISKILIIVIVIGIVILAIFITILILKGKSRNNNIGNDKTPVLTGTIEEKLELCLEKEEFNKECEILFMFQENNKACYDLGKLRDRCLYNFAVNGRLDLCAEIEESGLRTKCEEESMILTKE